MKHAPCPLGLLSEEPIEASNKDFRNFRQFHARKTSRINNIFDVFMRLYHRADPLISEIILKSRPLRKLNKLPLPDELKHLLLDPK